MTRMMQMVCATIAVALLAGFRPGDPSGVDILRRIETQVGGVQDYTVTLDVVADIERLKVPPMHAVLYFKRPDKVHIASKNFAMLPRESMGMQFSKLNERYVVDSVLSDRKDKPVVYRLVLHPKDERSAIRKVRMQVHGERWTPERIEIPQADGRAMIAAFTYTNVSGYWLPSELVVHFETGTVDSMAQAPANPFGGAEQSGRGQMRGGGRAGTVTVRYSGYQVNTGLRDDVFVKQGEPK